MDPTKASDNSIISHITAQIIYAGIYKQKYDKSYNIFGVEQNESFVLVKGNIHKANKYFHFSFNQKGQLSSYYTDDANRDPGKDNRPDVLFPFDYSKYTPEGINALLAVLYYQYYQSVPDVNADNDIKYIGFMSYDHCKKGVFINNMFYDHIKPDLARMGTIKFKIPDTTKDHIDIQEWVVQINKYIGSALRNSNTDEYINNISSFFSKFMPDIINYPEIYGHLINDLCVNALYNSNMWHISSKLYNKFNYPRNVYIIDDIREFLVKNWVSYDLQEMTKYALDPAKNWHAEPEITLNLADINKIIVDPDDGENMKRIMNALRPDNIKIIKDNGRLDVIKNMLDYIASGKGTFTYSFILQSNINIDEYNRGHIHNRLYDIISDNSVDVKYPANDHQEYIFSLLILRNSPDDLRQIRYLGIINFDKIAKYIDDRLPVYLPSRWPWFPFSQDANQKKISISLFTSQFNGRPFDEYTAYIFIRSKYFNEFVMDTTKQSYAKYVKETKTDVIDLLENHRGRSNLFYKKELMKKHPYSDDEVMNTDAYSRIKVYTEYAVYILVFLYNLREWHDTSLYYKFKKKFKNLIILFNGIPDVSYSGYAGIVKQAPDALGASKYEKDQYKQLIEEYMINYYNKFNAGLSTDYDPTVALPHVTLYRTLKQADGSLEQFIESILQNIDMYNEYKYIKITITKGGNATDYMFYQYIREDIYKWFKDGYKDFDFVLEAIKRQLKNVNKYNYHVVSYFSYIIYLIGNLSIDAGLAKNYLYAIFDNMLVCPKNEYFIELPADYVTNMPMDKIERIYSFEQNKLKYSVKRKVNKEKEYQNISHIYNIDVYYESFYYYMANMLFYIRCQNKDMEYIMYLIKDFDPADSNFPIDLYEVKEDFWYQPIGGGMIPNIRTFLTYSCDIKYLSIVFNPSDNDMYSPNWESTTPDNFQYLSVKDTVYSNMLFYVVKNQIYIKLDWVYAMINLGTVVFDFIQMNEMEENMFIKIGGGLALLESVKLFNNKSVNELFDLNIRENIKHLDNSILKESLERIQYYGLKGRMFNAFAVTNKIIEDCSYNDDIWDKLVESRGIDLYAIAEGKLSPDYKKKINKFFKGKTPDTKYLLDSEWTYNSNVIYLKKYLIAYVLYKDLVAVLSFVIALFYKKTTSNEKHLYEIYNMKNYMLEHRAHMSLHLVEVLYELGGEKIELAANCLSKRDANLKKIYEYIVDLSLPDSYKTLASIWGYFADKLVI